LLNIIPLGFLGLYHLESKLEETIRADKAVRE